MLARMSHAERAYVAAARNNMTIISFTNPAIQSYQQELVESVWRVVMNGQGQGPVRVLNQGDAWRDSSFCTLANLFRTATPAEPFTSTGFAFGCLLLNSKLGASWLFLSANWKAHHPIPRRGGHAIVQAGADAEGVPRHRLRSPLVTGVLDSARPLPPHR